MLHLDVLPLYFTRVMLLHFLATTWLIYVSVTSMTNYFNSAVKLACVQRFVHVQRRRVPRVTRWRAVGHIIA